MVAIHVQTGRWGNTIEHYTAEGTLESQPAKGEGQKQGSWWYVIKR